MFFLFFITAHTQVYLCRHDYVIEGYYFKRGVCLTAQSTNFLLLVYEYFIELYISVFGVGIGP